MATSTALAESAQALFCAIADYIGTNNVEDVLNTDKFKTYAEFKESNEKAIAAAYKRIVTKGVTLSQMEAFLKRDVSWYNSSVLIGKKLVKELRAIDLDFDKIGREGFQEIYYFRDDRRVMGSISKLFLLAKKNGIGDLKNQAKLSDINKWNPADIYFSSKMAEKKLVEEARKYFKTPKALTFSQLNIIISDLIDTGDLLPLSLKKTRNDVTLKKVNFDRKEELELLKKIKIKSISNWQPYTSSTKSNAGTRDLRLLLESGEIKIRHVPSSNELKTEYIPSSGNARGGSIGSAKVFSDVVSLVDPVFARKVFDKFKKASVKFKEEQAKIDRLKNTAKIKKEEHLILTIENSGLNIVNEIMPILKEYFSRDVNRNLVTQLLYEYTTSRTELSGKFVIAK